ncbi:MAG TPA: helix-turn-helix domain-containing protein [Candidatus Binataceae bacterium]|nr:helix-turn-helix domain-containing protein [Candidatus Binataceae bacterium]
MAPRHPPGQRAVIQQKEQAARRKPGSAAAIRDPRRSRERILAAALAEFSQHGFAGARVDRIARRARINKRMLYCYFGDKDALYREIMCRRFALRAAQIERLPYGDPEGAAAFWWRFGCADRVWMRLMGWEALDARAGATVCRAERSRAYAQAAAQFRRFIARGDLSRRIDPRHALLLNMALTGFPIAFPQLTRLVTGVGPENRRFQSDWNDFLRVIMLQLKPAPRAARRKQSRGKGNA